MGWVNDALKQLRAGRPATVCPIGKSMSGRIESGQAVTISPVEPADVTAGDVVLVGWKGGYLLHLVKEATADQLLIGNNLGKTNGWVARSAAVGRVTQIHVAEPPKPPPTPPPPCPYCGVPLATAKAKQCFACGTDWHDPQNVVCRKNPDWNRLGLTWDALYVVELCQGPDGVRYTKYRAVEGDRPDPHVVFETPAFTGRQWVAWGYHEYAQHVTTTTGQRFTFDPHGVWLTHDEAAALARPARGEATRDQIRWATAVPPALPPR